MLNVASNLFTLSGGMLNVIMQNAVVPFKTYVQYIKRCLNLIQYLQFGSLQ